MEAKPMNGALPNAHYGLGQIVDNAFELTEGRLEVIDDLGGEDFGGGEVGGIFEGFIPQPEDIHVDLIAGEKLFSALLTVGDGCTRFERTALKSGDALLIEWQVKGAPLVA